MKLRELMPSLDGATTTLNGNVTREQLIGKPTLIHFWAVSCHLCKDGMKQVNVFRERYKGELHVISVHMPRIESDKNVDAVKQLAEQYGMTHPLLVDNDHRIKEAFDNRCVPTYYVFDADGIFRHYQAGSGGMHMLEKRIVRVIEQYRTRGDVS
ncbi:TlpA disulfide reductase family protein [Anoxybacillus sp. ST4]|uniref:TlpA family protein disulfide reductase n=1 Tax=Anoxybacillus sp. ST4 TaxID=2864181 RepID=UPI001C64393B|nr:TlpA disulfide reductase family protein [Anoxybacillus sp. ST4]MBW7651075.1 TlpA family protein disulfide reductase [Anoxybacillus sp. ST4]